MYTKRYVECLAGHASKLVKPILDFCGVHFAEAVEGLA